MLKTHVNTKSKVEEELSKLKSVGLDETNSIGFMFACCGRGKSFYKRKSNVESDAFRRIFPKTELIGIFGNGEIGLSYLPNEKPVDSFSDPSASKRMKLDEEKRYLPREFSHSFTTVFVLISFS